MFKSGNKMLEKIYEVVDFRFFKNFSKIET